MAAILLRKDKVTTAEELNQFMKKEKGKYPDSFLLTHSGKLNRKAFM